LAIYSRKVIFSLFAGIITGALISAKLNILQTFMGSVDTVLRVFDSQGNTATIIFAFLIGAVISLVEQSGGVTAFVNLFAKGSLLNSAKKSKLFTMIIGILLFIESNISILTSGTIARPIFKKFKISQEKLAYLLDSTCAPVKVLIPINAWGALLISQIALNYNGSLSATDIFLSSMAYFFYPMVALIIVFATVIFPFDIGPIKHTKAEEEVVDKEDELVNGGHSSYFFVPILSLVLGMLFFMVITGDGDMRQGDGSKSVMYAVMLSLIASYFWFAYKKVFDYEQYLEVSFIGIKNLLRVVIILILAFAINIIAKDLQTGKYIANLLSQNIPNFIIPALIFVISALISFSTGTSWGTFAIMMSIGLPAAVQLDINIPLVVGALVSGGVWGDHCSPISDTTVISSLASGCSHIDHVKTQLPYAMLGGGISVILFLIFGVIS
ncbi:MAG: sodium:proton antiporter, partial [Calditrichaeota bacterium]|nr:sodium:proton antiporter [Calditrichota bacterium]